MQKAVSAIKGTDEARVRALDTFIKSLLIIKINLTFQY
tara:strand:- start:6460 stop:6573 length:114 start_codon:yes stop_codon:yes gene_type:complete